MTSSTFGSSPHRAAAHPVHMARVFDRDVVPGTVSAAAIDLLGRYLDSQGVARDEVISAQDQQSADMHGERYPAEAFCQLLSRAAERLQDPCMGFHMGLRADVALLGPLGYAMMACDNLGAALLHLQHYFRLVQDANPLQPLFSEGKLVLQWASDRGRPGALFDELGITGMVKLVRDLCQDRIDPAAIDFANPPPRDVTPYQSFFRCPVRFGQASTSVAMPLTALLSPLKRPDPTLLKLMARQMDTSLSHVPVDEDIVATTRRIITNLAARGVPELEQVASALSMAPKVLYRRLMEQGHNFRALREQALGQLAQDQLRNPNMTLAEISARLGYTEQSAFTRAFKRWTGITPIQWRARHVDGPDPDTGA